MYVFHFRLKKIRSKRIFASPDASPRKKLFEALAMGAEFEKTFDVDFAIGPRFRRGDDFANLRQGEVEKIGFRDSRKVSVFSVVGNFHRPQKRGVRS